MASFSNYHVGLLGILRETPSTYLVCNGDTMGIKLLKVFPQTEIFFLTGYATLSSLYVGMFEIPWDGVAVTTSSTESHTTWSILNKQSEFNKI